jgi:APA family basic amino acid/polyamine antiporter
MTSSSNSAIDARNGSGAAEKQIGFASVLMMTVGFSVGPYVFSLLGIGVAMTGTSAWLAMVVTMAVGLFQVLPWCFAGSVLRAPGADYQLTSVLLSRKAGGMVVWCFPIMTLASASMTASLAMYIIELFTDSQTVANFCAVGLVAIVFVVNLFGIGPSSNAQNWMTVLLFAAVIVFAGYLCLNLKPGIAVPSDPMWMTGGPWGFFMAMNLFTFFASYHTNTFSIGAYAKNPFRDVPASITLTSIIIMVFYGFLSFAAIGAAGFDGIVGITITFIARNVMPMPVFVLFMILAPLLSIFTSVNASLVTAGKVVEQGAIDGWFPKFIAKKNRFGVPALSLTVILLVMTLPTVFNYDIMHIVSNCIFMINIVLVITLLALWQLPKRFPEEWKRSKWHVPNPVFYLSVILCFVIKMFFVVISASNLTPFAVVVSLAALVLAGAISFFRYKRGYVPDDAPLPDDLLE